MSDGRVDTDQQAAVSYRKLSFKYGQGKNGNLWRDTRQGAKNRSDISKIGAHSRLDESKQQAFILTLY